MSICVKNEQLHVSNAAEGYWYLRMWTVIWCHSTSTADYDLLVVIFTTIYWILRYIAFISSRPNSQSNTADCI